MGLKMKYIQNRAGTFYVVVPYPPDVVPVLGRKVFKQSLRTRDRDVALRAAIPVIDMALAAIESARTPAANLPAISAGLIDLGGASEAIERWKAAAMHQEYLASTNGLVPRYELRSAEYGVYVRGPEYRALNDLSYRLSIAKWSEIPNFDERLVEVLLDQQIRLTVSHPIVPLLRQSFGDAWHELLQVGAAFRRGDYSSYVPPEPIVAVESPRATIPAMQVFPQSLHGAEALETTISALVERFMASKAPNAKDASEIRGYAKRLIEFLGDCPITDVTTSRLDQFLVQLRRFPAMAKSKEMAKRLTFIEIVDKFGDDESVPKLTNKTIRTKWFGAYNRLFQWAVDKLKLSENPVTKAIPKKADDIKSLIVEREEWAPEQIREMFSKPLFVGSASVAGSRRASGSVITRDRKYWLPLIALWTGMRLDEIGATTRDELKLNDGVWFFDLQNRPLVGPRRVKNTMSQRIVPVHSQLIELGFIEYVKLQRDWLFADLPHEGKEPGDTTKGFSKWFGRWRRANGMHSDLKKQDFHSFRHNFKNACRKAELAEDIHDLLTGHAGSNSQKTSRGYKGADDPVFLSKMLNRVTYDTFPKLETSPHPA